MDKKATPFLAKSPSSAGISTAEHQEEAYNAITVAAHEEAQKIMAGKKKTKTYSSAEEFLADLKV